nr:FGGY family carbohydrate kinase [Pseudomarimonas arenosa]
MDLGGHAARCFAYLASGERLAQSMEPIATAHPARGRVEHDAAALLQACRQSIGAVLAQLQPPEQGVPLAISCQRASVLAWSRDDCRPLSPVLSWQDSRAADRIEACRQHWPELQRISGLRPNAFVGASKLGWLVEHVDGLRVRLQTGQALIGPLASFLQQALIGEAQARCAYTLAQRSLLFDIQRLTWSASACALFGLRADWLPRPQPDVQVELFGSLPWSTATSLRCELQAGDQNLLPAALSEHGTSPTIINLGTGAFVLSPGEAGPGLLRSLLPTADTPDATAEGTVNAAGAAFEWLAKQRHWHSTPWQAIRSPGRDAPLCLPAPSGLGSPDWRALPRFEFSAEPADDAAAISAVAEGIAFLLRRNIDCMRAAGSDPIALGGGLSRSEDFCQLLANSLQRALYTVDEDELSAYGAARLLWRIHGIELPAPRVAARFTPNARATRIGEQRYQRWQAEFFP